MHAWFSHEPVQGRLGPFAAEEMRRRYRERRLQRDTLVWREGMSEWRPWREVMAEVVGGHAAPAPEPARARADPGGRTPYEVICDTVVVDKYAFTDRPELQREGLDVVTLVVIALGVLLVAAIFGLGLFVAMMADGG